MTGIATTVWPTRPLIEVATLQRGYDLPVGQRVAGVVPVFAANGSVGTHNVAKVVGPGVVTGRSGTIGRVHHVVGDFWPLNTSLYVKDFHGNDPRYVYYLLKNMDLARYHEGSGVPTLNRNNVHSIEVPVPPLEEQLRIATILDHADAIRTKRRRILARLDELEQSIFLTMFGHDREMWPISELCELIVDCVNRTAPTVDGITPYKMLRTTNIKNGVVDTSAVKYVTADTFNTWNRRATPKRGDVLLTREAPVGEAGVLESDDRVFLGQRLMLYRVDPEVMTSEYLAACFRSPILQNQFARLGSGSTVKHLPLPTCRSFQIPTAPVSAQRQYSARVATLSSRRAVVQRALATDNELVASLQSRAFSGSL